MLFPISGQLTDGSYLWNGHTYRMKNHGVAKNRPWQVVSVVVSETATSIELAFSSNKYTLEEFPFDFELRQKYINHSDEAMPIYPGFHPYFKSTEKRFNLLADASIIAGAFSTG